MKFSCYHENYEPKELAKRTDFQLKLFKLALGLLLSSFSVQRALIAVFRLHYKSLSTLPSFKYFVINCAHAIHLTRSRLI